MLCRDLSVGKVARHTGGEIGAEVGFGGTSSAPRLDLGTSRKIPREARDDSRDLGEAKAKLLRKSRARIS